MERSATGVEPVRPPPKEALVTSRSDSTMYASGYLVDPEGRVGSWNDDTLAESVHPTLAHCLHHIADRM